MLAQLVIHSALIGHLMYFFWVVSHLHDDVLSDRGCQLYDRDNKC
jgi:hypothetical protein